MGPGIYIPLLLIAIGVPVTLAWAKKNLKDAAAGSGDDPVTAPAIRLTSNALRGLPTPPWRVVYEIAHDKLGGIEHVLVGPAGVFALQTSMETLPGAPARDVDPQAVAAAAIVRGSLDDALGRCAMSSDRLIRVHWGAGANGSVDLMPGLTAVDGRSLTEWTEALADRELSPAQVDLAWQTVLTAIGRPDPLA
jgi:hypothetical protein